MGKIPDHEIDYIRWQNRACRFYIGARLLHRNELHAPASYSAVIAIELLLKATLIYWDRTFNPLDAGHGIAKLVRMVTNKAHNAKGFKVPSYFYEEQRYLTVSRYPTNGKGIGTTHSFLDDLDNVFATLLLLVPFQHISEFKRALSGKNRLALLALRYRNQQMPRLRAELKVKVKRDT